MKTGYATWLSIVLLLLGTTAGRAQDGGTVRGRITAAAGPLELVSVALAGTSHGASTDAAGEYALTAPAGPYELVVSFVGYQPQRRAVVVRPGQTTEVSLTLRPAVASLREVLVTGVSRATELRRSAVPVAVLSRRDLRLNGGSNAVDAAVRGVPGLSAVTTGPNISKPFIRGLGYNRVLTLYDGLRQEGQQWGDEHGIEIDQYDIGRVEVVKGPASLMYGSDAVAGVVNMLPQLPTDPAGELHGETLAEYQTNHRLLGSSAALRYQQRGWQYAGRASYRRAQAYRNAVDGRVYGTAFGELNLTALAAVEKPWGGSQLSATLYDNRQEIPDGSRDSLSRRFTRQVLEGDLDDLRRRPLVPSAALATYRIQDLHQRIRHYRLLSRSHVRLGGGELSTLLGAQLNGRQEFNHPTAPAQAGLAVTLATYTADLRYAAAPWRGLEATLGLNTMRQLNRNRAATDFPIPDYNLTDLGGYLLLKRTFGLLDLTGGLRYDTRQLSWADFYVDTDPATGFTRRAHPAPGAATPQFAAFRTRYHGLSASLGGSYAVSERVVLRANLARGYRAPNVTEVGSNGLDPGAHIVYLGNRTFRPEFSFQQDLGLSATLPTADLSVSVFNNAISHYIYQARLTDAAGQPVVLVPGNATYQYQQGRARLYGLETTARLHPAALPGLELLHSLAYVTGLNQDAARLEAHGTAARYLPLIPPLQSRAEVRYTHPRPRGAFSQPYARAVLEWSAAQNRFYALDDTETRTAGYALLGLGAGTALIAGPEHREWLQLMVQVDNVLDTAYQSHLNRLKYFEYYAATPNGRRGIFNPGRNLRVQVTVPF